MIEEKTVIVEVGESQPTVLLLVNLDIFCHASKTLGYDMGLSYYGECLQFHTDIHCFL